MFSLSLYQSLNNLKIVYYYYSQLIMHCKQNIWFGSSLGLKQKITIAGRHASWKREYLPYCEWYRPGLHHKRLPMTVCIFWDVNEVCSIKIKEVIAIFVRHVGISLILSLPQTFGEELHDLLVKINISNLLN